MFRARHGSLGYNEKVSMGVQLFIGHMAQSVVVYISGRLTFVLFIVRSVG